MFKNNFQKWGEKGEDSDPKIKVSDLDPHTQIWIRIQETKKLQIRADLKNC